jgi:hypothetical protein
MAPKKSRKGKKEKEEVPAEECQVEESSPAESMNDEKEEVVEKPTRKRKRTPMEKYQFSTEKEMKEKLRQLEEEKSEALEKAKERVDKNFAAKFRRFEQARLNYLKEHESDEMKNLRTNFIEKAKKATKEEILCFQEWEQELKKRRQETGLYVTESDQENLIA